MSAPEASQGRVAVITGAGRGIGRAVALVLARAGYSLCLAARSRDELEETRSQSGLSHERALIVLVDLATEDAPDLLIGAALDCYGRIDVLINNAGWAPPRTPLLKMRPVDVDRMIAVNLRAPIALTRLAAAAMTAQGAGTIVNVASTAASKAPSGEAVYAATKAALIAFTRAAFHEMRLSGLKLSVIVPGLVDTALIPNNKRLARAAMLSTADVAHAVMQIVNSPAGACPVEVMLEPQLDPERPR
ncbi:MAG TPA: SDR family oxidoreductase [Candidatus Binatus sp.]|uniref:SDR family NAD(P)-dependent oxidoreductase n=1 Tax=Candidatus Binatus sp. TaxID=2811406 RepID=UPI002B4A8E30|nr:SDR family oxidoreductase [Candidatus Binatus sp.]HKN11804.1 SDR family oxidoreductase [Candidatus Binatus sp.]